MTARPHVVCDFDGTLTLRDIGSAICARFATRPLDTRIRDAWLAGEVSLPDFQRAAWQGVVTNETDALALAREIGALRPGAEALLAGAREGRWDLTIASGGFGFYIRALLGGHRSSVARLIHNELTFAATGTTLHFNDEGFSSQAFAVCKGKVIEAVLAETQGPLVFCGDGRSDGGVLPYAAHPRVSIHAVPGRALADRCEKASAAYVPLESFETVIDTLAA